jgi:hypothetical protein
MKLQLLLASIAAAPLLLALVFRVNSVMIFLSIAVGSMLQKTLGESASLALSSVMKHGPVDQVANVLLLALPLVLTLFFARKTMQHSSVFLQLVPLVSACAAGAALALPLLTPSVQATVYGAPFGHQLKQMQDLIIALAAVLNLLLAWRVYRYHDYSGGHKK